MGCSATATDREEEKEFDLIIGSDLAYRDELHDPLIDAFQQVCSTNTIILLGITMTDTKPIFFTKLMKMDLDMKNYLIPYWNQHLDLINNLGFLLYERVQETN